MTNQVASNSAHLLHPRLGTDALLARPVGCLVFRRLYAPAGAVVLPFHLLILVSVVVSFEVQLGDTPLRSSNLGKALFAAALAGGLKLLCGSGVLVVLSPATDRCRARYKVCRGDRLNYEHAR